MNASRNFAPSQLSDDGAAQSTLARRVSVLSAFALVAAISFFAARWCFERGYPLYYGDAEAHLNIARRVVDSRTPGLEQVGTVWLPLPHLMMIPFVMRDDWWKSGLAGVIPSCICFVLAGTFLFAAGRRAYSSTAAAFAVVLIFALNPNMLYLQSTPMTEALFAAALAALVWAIVWFQDSQSWPAIVSGGAAAIAGSLTRYEGWFLIPFAALYLLLIARRKWHAVLFGALAALGPLAWLAHNQFYYSNALEFYNGPWSAMAIYRRQLAQSMQPYPGDHDWRTAFRYYLAAAKLVVGLPLISGAGGAFLMFLFRTTWTRAVGPMLILALPPAFYVWSMHSSGTPIFVPSLWPFSWYNTRYAIAVLPWAAFASGAIVAVVKNLTSHDPSRDSAADVKSADVATRGTSILVGGVPILVALLITALPAADWWLAFKRNHQSAICWKESEVNSTARRAWTQEAATFLAANYRPGSGIIFSFGDLTGVLREAGIPLRESTNDCNGPAFTLALIRPYPALRADWALAFSGDDVATAVLRANRFGRHYELRKQIIVKGAPVVEIYQLR